MTRKSQTLREKGAESGGSLGKKMAEGWTFGEFGFFSFR
jgi:hypothetical protein